MPIRYNMTLVRLIILISFLALGSTRSYDGFKVIEVNAQKPQELKILGDFSRKDESLFDFFTRPMLNRPTRVMVHPNEVSSFIKLLSENAIHYRVINENFGESIESELRLQYLLKKLKPYRPGVRLGTERYYTHDEINSYIMDLAERFPRRANVKTVGKSYEGRLLKTITISNGDGRRNKNVVLMDGGFHAREWISPAAAVYIIEQLVENFDENADLLKDYDWVVLPVVNADGYEYTQLSSETRMWRKTRKPNQSGTQLCYGTDPNRNFDYHWGETGSSPDPCSNTYAGPKPFSEPEAIVVRDLIHSQQGRGIMYLTLHSYGSLLLYPWGWAPILPDTWEDLQEVGDAGASAILTATGTEYTVGCSTLVLYAAAGASDDFAFYSGFPISFTMELPAGGENGFDPPPSSIDSYVKETWIGVRAMARKLLEKYPLNSSNNNKCFWSISMQCNGTKFGK